MQTFSSYFLPTMVIFPSVNVPVLSVQMTLALPKVSTAANRLTITFLLTILLQPIESEIVTQRGIPLQY
jgi:hypothetical protein